MGLVLLMFLVGGVIIYIDMSIKLVKAENLTEFWQRQANDARRMLEAKQTIDFAFAAAATQSNQIVGFETKTNNLDDIDARLAALLEANRK